MEYITYITPNYNKEKYLEDWYESLMAQDCDRWCAFITDDASTDGSAEFIKNLVANNDKFICVQNSKNLGSLQTMINMIANSPTDIIGILDSDDALLPQATAKILEEYDKGARGFVYSNFMLCDETLLPLKEGWCRKLGEHEAIYDCPPSHLKTFRRTTYNESLGYDLTLSPGGDKDLVYKLSEVTTPYFVDAILYNYRILPESASNGATFLQAAVNANRAIQNFKRRKAANANS